MLFRSGTILYTFYQNAASLPKDFNTSAIVPYFVITQLPAGIAGFVIAGIFAAAQSTIASSLNSISACFVTDFKQRFFNNKFKGMSDVTLARLVIIIAGVISTTITVYFTMGNTSDTWNVFLTVSGLFGVPVAGLFALGIFTKRANARGVLIGFALSVLLAFYVDSLHISSLLVATVSFTAAVVLGYLASLLFPGNNKDNQGLTIYTLKDKVKN